MIEESQRMADELSKYSRSTIQEFQKLFPIEKLFDEKINKHNYYNYYIQNIIPKEGPQFMVNVEMLCEDPYIDFWRRWNRFKSLKAFL